ncbi:MAG: AAA family ATPase [Bacteriovoracia bacterium]
MKKGTLIIFSGLPGSGKSTLASLLATHLKATYLRIDTLEQGLKDV